MMEEVLAPLREAVRQQVRKLGQKEYTSFDSFSNRKSTKAKELVYLDFGLSWLTACKLFLHSLGDRL